MNYSIGLMQKALSPNPFCLVTSLKENGDTNVMALSWWTYVSNHPATVAIATSNRGLTGENIRRSGEFTLCFAPKAFADKAMGCAASGHMKDKVKELSLPMKASSVVKPMQLEGCYAVMECKLVDTKDVGDHTVYFAEVVETHLDETVGKPLMSFDGYSRLDTL